ncbi:MAG TPA: YihY/virulence factor BrkB family protein [Kofleriaceae bacterium]|nr:YihY/virulence factor BrkB family protein [Kofleriaceae bacterium]
MQVKRFAKRLGKELIDDGITDIGAMMAYYAVLALFPMLVFVLSLALLVLDDSTVRDGVTFALSAAPQSVRPLVLDRVTQLVEASSAGFAFVGAALALWGASRGAVGLMTALNTIFEKKETRSWLRRQLIAIAVTLGVAILIVAALGLLFLGPFVGHFLADRFGLGDAFDVVWGIGRWVGAGVLVMLVWAVLYKFLANTDAPFRIFTPGAIVGVIAWLGISALFGLYLGHFNSYEATYGTLGGAIIFLTWLWLSNMTLLLGAEINDVLADFKAHEDPAAAALSDEGEHGGPPATPATVKQEPNWARAAKEGHAKPA